jgi:hypothetical protein
VAELAQEVVQQAQRERIAGLAINDARVREARHAPSRQRRHCRRPRPGWPAALRRWTGQDDLDERERAADERNHLADQRDHLAEERDRTARDGDGS